MLHSVLVTRDGITRRAAMAAGLQAALAAIALSAPTGPTLATLVSLIVFWPVYSLQAGALTLLVSQAYLGGPVDPFQAYANAASRFWTLLLTTVSYFAIGVFIPLVITAPLTVWCWVSGAFHNEIVLLEGKRGFDVSPQ